MKIDIKAKPQHGIGQGIREAIAFSRGKGVAARVHIPAEINVRAMRVRLSMTEKEFSSTFKIPVDTLSDWG